MNYKQQVHFLNDVTTWRAHVSALITMDIIKSPFLNQCSLYSNVYGFKIVQKRLIQSSSNLQEENHLSFSCQQSLPDLMKPTSIPSIFFYLPLQKASSICWKPIDEVTPQLEAYEPETHFTAAIHTSQQVYNCDHAPPINNMGSDLIIDSNF